MGGTDTTSGPETVQHATSMKKMVKCHIYTSVFVNKMLIIELNCMFRQSGTTKPKTQIEANLQKAA